MNSPWSTCARTALGPLHHLCLSSHLPSFPPATPCGFYKRLNTELRDRNRALLVQAFFPALRLLLSAINKLPKVKTTVYRGVKKSLLDKSGAAAACRVCATTCSSL